MGNVYGIINSEDVHIDISSTERGAKRFATLNGYKMVSVRYNGGCNAEIIAIKMNKVWKSFTIDLYKEIKNKLK